MGKEAQKLSNVAKMKILRTKGSGAMSCSKILLVCAKGKSCSKRDSAAVIKSLRKVIAKRNLEDFFTIKKSECFGLCSQGPIIMVAPDGCKYGDVNKADCRDIVKRHAKKKKPIKSLVIAKNR